MKIPKTLAPFRKPTAAERAHAKELARRALANLTDIEDAEIRAAALADPDTGKPRWTEVPGRDGSAYEEQIDANAPGGVDSIRFRLVDGGDGYPGRWHPGPAPVERGVAGLLARIAVNVTESEATYEVFRTSADKRVMSAGFLTDSQAKHLIASYSALVAALEEARLDMARFAADFVDEPDNHPNVLKIDAALALARGEK